MKPLGIMWNGYFDAKNYNLPDGWQILHGRSSRTLNRLGVENFRVVDGWWTHKGFKKYSFNGYLVPEGTLEKFPELRKTYALPGEAIPQKTSPEVLAERRRKKWRREVLAFSEEIKAQFPKMDLDIVDEIARHACTVSSGRVGRTSTLSLSEKVTAACVAHYRHNETDYDAHCEALRWDYHDRDERDEARDQLRRECNKEAREILRGLE